MVMALVVRNDTGEHPPQRTYTCNGPLFRGAAVYETPCKFFLRCLASWIERVILSGGEKRRTKLRCQQAKEEVSALDSRTNAFVKSIILFEIWKLNSNDNHTHGDDIENQNNKKVKRTITRRLITKADVAFQIPSQASSF